MLVGGFWNAVENPEGFKAINAKMVVAPTGPDGNRSQQGHTAVLLH